MTELIGLEAERFGFLEDSEHLSENEKKRYKAIISLNNGMNTMNEKMLISSLRFCRNYCTSILEKGDHLIDEYDVPLDKAFQNGFYREMVSLIRGLFGMALKTNDSLQFAVLTGCMRISKESIFTGLNNFEVLSILNDQYDESFGFTDAEVKKKILNDENNLKMYLEENYELTSERVIKAGVDIVSNENKYHPIRDYLESLVWDGVPRIENMLPHFSGSRKEHIHNRSNENAHAGSDFKNL